MKCQSCNQNLATVHLTEIVQKTKKETHLCEACAKEKGVSYTTQFSVKDFLGGLKKASEDEPEVPTLAPLSAMATAPEPTRVEEQLEPCATCGITFSEFRQSGRLGCGRDYDHFRAGLIPLLRKIHGNVQHTGRVPAEIGQRLERERALEALREELQAAIGREAYEDAATLRDKIQAMEQA